MNNWQAREEKYFIEVYDTKDSYEYNEIEINDKVQIFRIADELLYAGKFIRVRKEIYYE